MGRGRPAGRAKAWGKGGGSIKGNATTGSDGEGLQGRTRPFLGKENRDAFVLQPHKILVPSGSMPASHSTMGLRASVARRKTPMNSLGP